MFRGRGRGDGRRDRRPVRARPLQQDGAVHPLHEGAVGGRGGVERVDHAVGVDGAVRAPAAAGVARGPRAPSFVAVEGALEAVAELGAHDVVEDGVDGGVDVEHQPVNIVLLMIKCITEVGGK